jgi:hypothetical protein
MAGKLLREFGSPEAVFHASLTALEAQRLPAAVAQAIHSREPLSRAAKELAQVQQAGSRLLTWDEPAYPHLLRRFTIRRQSSIFAATWNLCTATASQWWVRVVRRPTGIKWQSGWRGT